MLFYCSKNVCFSAVVGAPQDNVTDASVHASVRALDRPGAVYSCPMTSGRHDCDWLPIDVDR